MPVTIIPTNKMYKMSPKKKKPNSIIHLKYEQGLQWLEFFQYLTTHIDLGLKQ